MHPSHAMRFGRQMLFASLFAGVVACSRKAPEPVASKAAPVALPAAPAEPTNAQHGTRKLMGLDTPVFVDGAQVAVLRFGEMPPVAPILLEGGGRRYKVYEYLKAIGVAPESIKSIHFHGNSDRIASVEGSELRKEKDRFVFSFISGDTGTPLQKWDTDNLKNEFVIHEIRRMTIYVNKPVPTIDAARQCHVDAEGKCTDAIPYATGEVAKGTRVYVDGKMVGYVKRRLVTDAMMIGAPAQEPSESTYSLGKLLSGLGVDATGATSVELMAGDDVVARATGEQFTSLAPNTSFTLPKHGHGKVRIHVPAELQASSPGATDRDALVSAVLVYKRTAPTKQRELVAISEDTDLSVQLAAIDTQREPGRGAQ